MVAGKGVTHTERTPADLRTGQILKIHGYQIWVALPRALEQMDPEFHHLDKKELPAWSDGPAQFVLVAGEGYGRKSPLPVHSPLFMVEIKTTSDYELKIDGEVAGELGICIVEGGIQACEHTVSAGSMLVSKADGACSLNMKAGTHLFLFGGEPFPEERFIYWNWVATSRDILEKAKDDWQNRRFPTVPGDDTYIPMP